MSKRTTESVVKSSPEWDELEDWLRGSMQKLIQEILEEEVTGFFGRVKSARRSEEDSDSGYRNGYARPRKLTLSGGTIELRRPRVRNTEERFESRLLPLFAKRTAKVSDSDTAVVLTRAVGGGLRLGVARVAWRGCAAVGGDGGAAERQVEWGACRVAGSSPR